MRIANVSGNNTKAAASFSYKNWTVSMSSIMKEGSIEVLAWKETGFTKSFNNVEKALLYINKQ
jgi:hypothetical protein